MLIDSILTYTEYKIFSLQLHLEYLTMFEKII